MKIRIVSLAFIVVAATTCRALAEEKPKAPDAPATKSPVVTASEATTNEIVARVNGSAITRKDLDASVRALVMQMGRQGRQVLPGTRPRLEYDVLDEMIGRELLLQEGSKHSPTNVDQKTQAQMELVTKQLGGEEQLKKALAETGATPAEYSKRVRDNLIVQDDIQQLVEKEAKVTPEEIKSFYDQNPDQFQQPETVRASHILIRVPEGASDDVKKDKRAQIEAARSLVKGGEKFADVARKVSEDPGSAANGGDLGFFPRGAMVPEFDAAAFSLKTNTVSDVITTQFGYHILMVTDKKAARAVPLEEVKSDLGDFLKRRKSDDVTRNHVAQLRKAAKVEVLLPTPPAASTGEASPAPAPAAK